MMEMEKKIGCLPESWRQRRACQDDDTSVVVEAKLAA